MTERVEEIRRRIEKGLDVVIAGDTPAQDWDITDDVEQWLAALAQAERELYGTKQARGLREEVLALRAEVERLKRHLAECHTRATAAEADLARVRAALERIANHPHQSYPDNCGPYEIGVSDGHRCAANEARAALEGR